MCFAGSIIHLDIDPSAEVGGSGTPFIDTVRDALGAALLEGLSSTFACMRWADDEIQSACRRHPDQASMLYHAFSLLRPTHERMRRTEFVYRAHCAELLDRVAAHLDTRPGTAAEVCCAMLQVSVVSPLRSSAIGLYMRMWQAAGFPDLGFAEASAHHEALEAFTINDHEEFARRKLAVAGRRLGEINCSGRHHGEDVECAYARPGIADRQ